MYPRLNSWVLFCLSRLYKIFNNLFLDDLSKPPSSLSDPPFFYRQKELPVFNGQTNDFPISLKERFIHLSNFLIKGGKITQNARSHIPHITSRFGNRRALNWRTLTSNRCVERKYLRHRKLAAHWIRSIILRD